MNSAAPPVLVLGTGVTALGALRVLGRCGISAYAVAGGDPLHRRSRWYRKPPFAVPADGLEQLETWMPRLPIERAVLLPCSDTWARSVAAAHAVLGDRFHASVAPPAVLELLLDKGRFAETLAHLRIAHPWSSLTHTITDLDSISDHVLASAFLKPRDSQRFFQAFGVKAFRIASRREAAERLRKVEALGLSVILQEYIPGPASNHYFVDGFIDAAGVRRSTFVRQRLRMYPPDFGNSSCMVSIPPEVAAGALDSVTRLLQEIGYRGIFSAEFKLDPRDGEFKLLEVNARAWWYVEFAARCGVNVCIQAYHDALDQPVQQITKYRVGKFCVYPYYDINACRELRRRGALTLWDWTRSWLGAMQPVFQFSDPLPALGSVADLLIGKARPSNKPQPVVSRVEAKPPT